MSVRLRCLACGQTSQGPLLWWVVVVVVVVQSPKGSSMVGGGAKSRVHPVGMLQRKATYSPLTNSKGICPLLLQKAAASSPSTFVYKGVPQGDLPSLFCPAAMAPSPPCRQAVEVRPGDHSPRKWCMSLREDVFSDFFARGGGDVVRAVFGEGSLFSPMLFGKFFDPADAFPLWDFESQVLLAGLRDAVKSRVDWSETDVEYVFRAELPGIVKNDLVISLENGRVIEISGQWRGRESNRKDWRTEHWWEYGYVRRLELPEDANMRKTVAYVEDDIFLEIKIPKNVSGYSASEAGNGSGQDDT